MRRGATLLFAFLLNAVLLTAGQDLEYAVSLYDAGSYTLAYQTFAALADSSADDREKMQIFYYMAMCKYHSREYSQAQDLIYSQLKQYPVNSYKTELLYVLGEIEFDQRNYAQAIRQYQKLIKQFPRSSEAFRAGVRVAAIYRLMDRPAESEDVFRKLLKKPLSPQQKIQVWFDLADLLNSESRTDEAFDVYQSIVLNSKNIKDISLSQSRMAGIRLDQGRYDEAADRFLKLLQKFPDLPRKQEIEYKYAYCLQRLGRGAESKTAYTNIRTTDTNLSLNIAYRLSEIAVDEGRTALAVSNLALLSTNRFNASLAEDASKDLVRLLIRQSEFDPALTVLSRITNRLFILSRRAEIKFDTGDYAAALTDYQAYFDSGATMENRDKQVFFLGQLHYALKDWADASRMFRQIYETMPSSVYLEESMYLMADCSVRQQDYDDSLIILNRLLSRTADPVWKIKCRESIAMVYFLKERYKDSADEYVHLSQTSSSNRAWFLYNAGLCYLKLDQPDKAVRYLNSALSNRSARQAWILSFRKLSELMLSQKRYDDYFSLVKKILPDLTPGPERENVAEELLNAEFQQGRNDLFFRDVDATLATVTNPGIVSRLLYLKAKAYFNAGDCASSLSSLKDLRARVPDSRESRMALYDMGNCLVKLGDTASAEKYFDLFTESGENPELAIGIDYDMGQYFYRERNFGKSRAYFTRLVLNFPQSDLVDNSLYWIGLSRFNEGDYTNAVADFERIVREYKDSDVMDLTLFRLGDCYSAISDYPQAVVYYKRLVLNFPQSSVLRIARYKLANAYEKLNNKPAALEIYRSLSSDGLDESARGASLDLAVYYRKEGNYAESLRILSGLAKSGFKPDEVVYNTAECLRLTGDFTNARTQYAKLLLNKDSPRTAEALYDMGFCYERLNDRKSAVSYYQRTADLFPETEWGKTARIKLEKLRQKE